MLGRTLELSGVAPGGMRRDETIVQPPEQIVRSQRLGGSDVQIRCGDFAGLQHLLQNLVDGRASADVVEDRGWLHAGEAIGVEEIFCLAGGGEIFDHVIRHGEQRLGRFESDSGNGFVAANGPANPVSFILNGPSNSASRRAMEP